MRNLVKYTFSGHDSFQCRHLWIKKGYDFIKGGNTFNDEDAVLKLGVGKNMVSSIRYWLKAFEIIDKNEILTPFADSLLSANGWDPFLEDEATLWLLHYHLVKGGIASSYNIIFNELRREKVEFSKENFLSFVRRKAEALGNLQINEKTLAEDFNVLTKMYIRSDAQNKDKEDSFSGLLTELDLMRSSGKRGEEIYIIENKERNEIPDEVVLYAILDKGGFESSINLTSLEQEENNVGSVFAINRSGLVHKFQNLMEKYSYITFNDHAGIKELQFKEKPHSLEILKNYYVS